jgi:anti-anti-sigma regulatory factor
MFHASRDWRFDVEIGSGWLFLRLFPSDEEQSPSLAERIWAVADEHSIYRFVIELSDDLLLTSALIGQLVLLHKRSHQQGGLTRLCGLSPDTYQVIETMRLADRFPNYESREQAMAGYVYRP